MTWQLYILQCGNGDLYTGITEDLDRRVEEHRSGTGGRFTRMAQPVELVYHETLQDEQEASRRERQIKTWSRRKKLALIAGDLHALKAA